MDGTFRPPRDLMLQPFRAWIAAAAASSYHISGLRALTPPPGLRHSPYTPLTHPLSFGLSSFSLLLPWAPDLFRLHELWLFSLVRFHDHLPACSLLLTYLRSCSLSLWALAHFLLFAYMSSCLYMFMCYFHELLLFLSFALLPRAILSSFFFFHDLWSVIFRFCPVSLF